MSKSPIKKSKIKCRPKLDGSSIALIINYIEQTQKTTPGLAITWGHLEKRFNYSRQALEKHEPIKLAYRSANVAASAHKNVSGVHGDEAPEPISVTYLKKQKAKMQEENKKLKQQNAALLEYVTKVIREAQKKGISLAGMTGLLPQEHHHAIFQMTAVSGSQVNAEQCQVM